MPAEGFSSLISNVNCQKHTMNPVVDKSVLDQPSKNHPIPPMKTVKNEQNAASSASWDLILRFYGRVLGSWESLWEGLMSLRTTFWSCMGGLLQQKGLWLEESVIGGELGALHVVDLTKRSKCWGIWPFHVVDSTQRSKRWGIWPFQVVDLTKRSKLWHLTTSNCWFDQKVKKLKYFITSRCSFDHKVKNLWHLTTLGWQIGAKAKTKWDLRVWGSPQTT